MAYARKVLIVDDDESVRLFAQAVMEAENWQCFEAKHGEEAIDLAKREQPDLILLDLDMPKVNGFEAFERLRNSPFTDTIPIIVFSAMSHERGFAYSPDDFATAFDVRAPEGFVEKPVDAKMLRQCVFGVVG